MVAKLDVKFRFNRKERSHNLEDFGICLQRGVCDASQDFDECFLLLVRYNDGELNPQYLVDEGVRWIAAQPLLQGLHKCISKGQNPLFSAHELNTLVLVCPLD